MSYFKIKQDSFDTIEKSALANSDFQSNNSLDNDPFDIEIKTISISPKTHEATPLTHNVCSAGGSCFCSQAYAC
ncbi:MAG: hypothetical protein HWD61_02615 [Parachlamydiaceae bacterium]|nr:MAG: hypothetical protein HWD61_02615 [Parachlamydiaceae bacterium]